jgi:hypothetical protein
LPDTSSTCGNYNLVKIFPPYQYKCQTTQNYLKVDGNGWIPVNFTLGKIFAISNLPVDPLNNNQYFYAYQTRQNRYKLTIRFENEYNMLKMASDGGIDPTLYEAGTDLFISSPHSGLVGYWNFDEGTGTIVKDLSGYQNNGTLNNFDFNSSSGWVIGKIGQALSFDGINDYVGISSPANIPIDNSPYAIEVWIRPIASGIKGIVGWGNFDITNQVTALRLWGERCGNKLGFRHYWWGNDLDVCTDNFIDGRWYHVVALFDGTTRKIYLNGLRIAYDTPTGHNVPNASNFRIGSTNLGEYFSGDIDELRIYNRAFTDSEIKVLYESSK